MFPREQTASSTLRNAAERDLQTIVAIHLNAFRDSFLTKLGPRFLERYYAIALAHDTGILLVSERQSEIEGFVCGFLRPGEFYAKLRRDRRSIAIPVMCAVARYPSLAARVVYSIRSLRKRSTGAEVGGCELSSIAVSPQAAGAGVGKALLTAFLDRAWAMGAGRVYLLTDTDGNASVNAFYRKGGFRLERQFEQFGGRWMNEYSLDRPAAPPPDQVVQ